MLTRIITFLLCLAVVGSSFSAISAAGAAERPTIVLIHGAWSGPSAWDQTVASLTKAGFQTETPRMDLFGVASDVATVRAALDAIAGMKIVVAHSYGGIVASNAAYGRSDVLGLVYTAAFVPDAGDSIVTMGTGFEPSAVLAHLAWTGEPFASLCFIENGAFRDVFAADLSPKKAEELNSAQQPTSPLILFAPSGPVAWHTLPTWYAVSGSDLLIDPAQQRWMAQRAGSTVVEFDDASHAGGFTHYVARLTKLIEEAASATTN
ncbi:MAG TPA: alpha/beta hydrolase [Candidatus Limnocylindria bacterium]|nr:alpha/beta hydrolase [Candidatus Limnocylindria bacterium]